MSWGHMAILIAESPSTNGVGDTICEETRTEIFCNKKSIKRAEFYQAASSGFKPEVLLEIYNFDYNGEKKVEFENKVYQIIRTYEPDSEIIELTLEAAVI